MTAGQQTAVEVKFSRFFTVIWAMGVLMDKWPNAARVTFSATYDGLGCLGVTMSIIHGHCTLIFVSEPHLAHDSSWTSEVIAFSLNVLREQYPHIDYRKVHLSLHGDNSSKELKNNSVLRLVSGLTSTRRVLSASLNTLMSGHSHEDIDQSFSSLAAWIQAQTEVHTTDAFCQTMQNWLDQPQIRPDEPFKKVYRVDQVRAWKLSLNLLQQHFF